MLFDETMTLAVAKAFSHEFLRRHPIDRKRAHSITRVCFALGVTALGVGCASLSKHQDDRPAAALQGQNSSCLSALRYIAVLKAIETGDLSETKNDLDWWIDLAILELQRLEECHPRGRWEEVPMQGTTDFPLRHIYKRIAQFRRDHPRQHSVPLEAESLQRIEAFVQKYQ